MKSKSSTLVILFSLFFLLLSSSAISVCAAPVVDGFAGVPWGATQEQVQVAMTEKGFAFLGQTPGGRDKYNGTFAGHPAELQFSFNKNLFYCGEARIQDMPAPEEIWSVAGSFEDIKRMFVAKYGPANVEYTLGDERDRLGFGARWENLTAAATPKGIVSIDIRCLKKRQQTQFYGIIITYNIGVAWAGMKADGGGI